MKRPKVLLMHNALPAKNNAEVKQLLAGIRGILPDTTVIILSPHKRVSASDVSYYQLDLQGLHKLPQLVEIAE